MIADSVILFGSTGNVVVFVNGEFPKDTPVMFRIGPRKLEFLTNDKVIYAERGISPDICQKLKDKNEIGLVEISDAEETPDYLTNVAYQYGQG
jgi:hypothetical protein